MSYAYYQQKLAPWLQLANIMKDFDLFCLSAFHKLPVYHLKSTSSFGDFGGGGGGGVGLGDGSVFRQWPDKGIKNDSFLLLY